MNFDEHVKDMIDGMNHWLTIEFMIGGYDYVRDDMWVGRS